MPPCFQNRAPYRQNTPLETRRYLFGVALAVTFVIGACASGDQRETLPASGGSSNGAASDAGAQATTSGGALGGGGAAGGASADDDAGGRGGAAGGANAGGSGDAGGVSGADGGSTSTPFDTPAVMALMRRVADAEIARFGRNNDNGWVRAAFHIGLLAAYNALGDEKYRDYTLQWGAANRWLLHDAASAPRDADNEACVQSYAELYLAAPDPSNAVMLAAAQTTFDEMVAAPTPGRTEWWWCDSLFMAPPALVRVARATGKNEYLTLLDTMFWDTKDFLYDPVQGLFWRDSTFVGTDTYWSRGNGWVFAGIARILEDLPQSDARRTDYEALFASMAARLRDLQASDGFWRSSLTHPADFDMPETSGTAFFCFGLAWGIHHGLLDRESYLPSVVNAWHSLESAVSASGRLGWVQPPAAAPGASPADSTNDYATGALLLAGSEILAL